MAIVTFTENTQKKEICKDYDSSLAEQNFHATQCRIRQITQSLD